MNNLLLTLYQQRMLVTSAILFVIGFGGLLFNWNLIKKIVSLNIMDSALVENLGPSMQRYLPPMW